MKKILNKKYLKNRNRLLVCPECGEGINCTDIEYYQKCPYCDCALESTQELEDFILQPVVDHWINQYSMPLRDDDSASVSCRMDFL